uniref:Uncharacterized protein n=1 Tax=Trypanosoma vivax (strain Y486) TaxID=1055687 RepID=G0TUC2_TRYVY|nr:hypothetical protein TVY486_0402220 [Trypanosoma vivax Y486]
MMGAAMVMCLFAMDGGLGVQVGACYGPYGLSEMRVCVGESACTSVPCTISGYYYYCYCFIICILCVCVLIFCLLLAILASRPFLNLLPSIRTIFTQHTTLLLRGIKK